MLMTTVVWLKHVGKLRALVRVFCEHLVADSAFKLLSCAENLLEWSEPARSPDSRWSGFNSWLKVSRLSKFGALERFP